MKQSPGGIAQSKLENVTKFTKYHLRQSLIFIKSCRLSPCTGVFRLILEISFLQQFCRTLVNVCFCSNLICFFIHKIGCPRCFVRRVFWNILQNSQENVFTRLQPATLLKKKPRHRCFPCEFSMIIKSTYFAERLRIAASVYNILSNQKSNSRKS